MRRFLMMTALGLIGLLAWSPSQAMAFSPTGTSHQTEIAKHGKGKKNGGGKHAGKHHRKHHKHSKKGQKA